MLTFTLVIKVTDKKVEIQKQLSRCYQASNPLQVQLFTNFKSVLSAIPYFTILSIKYCQMFCHMFY